jgi:peroxiredoxin
MNGRWAAVIVALGLAARVAVASDPPASIPASPVLTAVDPATGQAVALDPSQGPMHVVFLATWCRPCLAELPRLVDLEDRWKPDGYRLFLVAVATRQTTDRLRELAAQEPLPGKLLFDANGSVAAAFGAATIPTHALVDRQGRIVARSGVLDAPFHQAVERLVRQEGRVKP